MIYNTLMLMSDFIWFSKIKFKSYFLYNLSRSYLHTKPHRDRKSKKDKDEGEESKEVSAEPRVTGFITIWLNPR